MFQVVELAHIYRGTEVESIHSGIAVLFSASGLKQVWGDADFYCYTRSIIKPIQTKVSQELLGVKLSSVELAVGTASHHAEPEQLKQIKALMQKFDIAEADLHCGIYSSPHHKLNSAVEHNCAGKHTLMIAACKKQNWDIRRYHELDHPLQQAIKNELVRLHGDKLEIGSRTAIDGCGVPTFYLSLKQMARIFTNMLCDPAYLELTQAMREHPFIIGGAKQIDSLLMKNSANLIAKGGAEGLMMIANLEKQEALLIKIIDGSTRAKSMISLAFAESLGWIEPGLIRLDNSICNSRNEVVGRIVALV
jgi:L-asparaginase